MPAESSHLSACEAIAGRSSVRRFLPESVADDIVRAILAGAARAASGFNMQPWFVYVATGESHARLRREARRAADANEMSLEYAYLPDAFKEPYLSRRRKLGHELYALYGIERSDKQARKEAMLRNFDFFGAPVGLFVAMDRAMSMGAWLDCGMFTQNIMILARAFGLETCPQQAWCDVGAVVHRELEIPEHQIVLSGMALGYADPDAPENTLVSERAPVDEFASWRR